MMLNWINSFSSALVGNRFSLELISSKTLDNMIGLPLSLLLFLAFIFNYWFGDDFILVIHYDELRLGILLVFMLFCCSSALLAKLVLVLKGINVSVQVMHSIGWLSLYYRIFLAQNPTIIAWITEIISILLQTWQKCLGLFPTGIFQFIYCAKVPKKGRSEICIAACIVGDILLPERITLFLALLSLFPWFLTIYSLPVF